MTAPQALPNNFRNIKYNSTAIRGRLRESLAEGIYPDVNSSFHVLRELVQNAVDTIKDFREQQDPFFEGEVRIRLSDDSISVYDNGLGMDLAKLREVPAFAASDKDPSTHVGFRGIGFWATSALASEVILISKKVGSPSKYALKIDVASWKKDEDQFSLLDLLNKHVYEDQPAAEVKDAHYTMIVLNGLTEAGQYLVSHVAEAEAYLRTTLPLEFENSKEFQRRGRIRELILENVPDKQRSTFKVVLNDTELLKPGYPALQEIIHDEIQKTIQVKGRKPKTETIGWYWAALHKQPEKIKNPLVKGIRFRVKGFAVGDENLLRNLFTADKETPDWYYGEIYVLDQKIKPDSSRTHFEGNQAWEEFVAALSGSGGLISKLKTLRRKFSESEKARTQLPELIAEVDVLSEKPQTTTSEEIQDIKTELEKRARHTTNPELKIAAQTATRKLEKLLSSRSAKSRAKKSGSKAQSALDRFYLRVRKILAAHIHNEALLKTLTKLIDAALKQALRGK